MAAVSERASLRNEGQPDALRVCEAIARIASTVHVLTTVSKGRRYGMATTAACSFAAEPLSILVSISRTAAIYAPILRSGAVCLNVLGTDDAGTAERFAGGTGVHDEDRFEAGVWRDTAYGLPTMPNAIASLDCTIASTMSLGTHTVFGCLVRGFALHDDANALPYANRASARAPLAPISGF